jgi:hypothetical protein
VFPALLNQQKWFKYKRDVKVGDIVLRKDKTAAGQTYKYERVAKVHVGTDGKVRAVDVEYKVPGEVRFHVTMRPIHRLVLIIPTEEQMTREGGEKKEALGLESKTQDEEVDNGVQGEEGVGTPETENAVGVEPLRAGGSDEGPAGEAQHKKAGPQKGQEALPTRSHHSPGREGGD